MQRHRIGLRKLCRVGLLVPFMSLAACSGAGESTAGELGRVNFSYSSSCASGCDLDSPVLIASTERIDVDGPGDALGVTAHSSHPNIASFDVVRHCACSRTGKGFAEAHSVALEVDCDAGWDKQCHNTIEMAALDHGDATLELLDENGDLIDRAPVYVRVASEVRVQQLGAGQGDLERLKLSLGKPAKLQLVAYAAGTPLLGDGGVWSVADPGVAGFSGVWEGSVQDSAGPTVWLEGAEVGTTQVTASVRGASVQLAVEVTE